MDRTQMAEKAWQEAETACSTKTLDDANLAVAQLAAFASIADSLKRIADAAEEYVARG
jgi:hypothetical protein